MPFKAKVLKEQVDQKEEKNYPQKIGRTFFGKHLSPESIFPEDAFYTESAARASDRGEKVFFYLKKILVEKRFARRDESAARFFLLGAAAVKSDMYYTVNTHIGFSFMFVIA
jgi:hypothetical protein